MVAYSFKSFFAPQILAGLKTQTVRADRRRHARPGEPVQLFTGMRTKACRKILTPDPVCVRVSPILIVTSSLIEGGIASITIGGWPQWRGEIEDFASADGFSPALAGGAPKMTGRTARENMGAFWLAEHGEGRFEGVLIEWSCSAKATQDGEPQS
jgi:hypothetical protein